MLVRWLALSNLLTSIVYNTSNANNVAMAKCTYDY